jgi:hypothetical protein
MIDDDQRRSDRSRVHMEHEERMSNQDVTQKYGTVRAPTMPLVNIVVMGCPPRDPEPLATALFLQGAQVCITIDGQRKGALFGAIQAFTVGLELGGPVTILQDDVEVCKNFVPYMAKYLHHVERFRTVIQWFCNGGNYNQAWQVETASLVERAPDKFLSTQAVTYPREVAAYILPWLQQIYAQVDPDDRGKRHSDDRWIQSVLMKADQKFYIHVPNLVQHMGEDSLVGPGIGLYDGFRQSKCYPGKGFNALQLVIPEPFNWTPRP